MARRNKRYDDDDGRTIVDMSGIGHPNFLSSTDRGEIPPSTAPNPLPNESGDTRPWEQDTFSKEERRALIGGALKAALLIALVFIGGLALVIALLLLLWK